MSEGVNIRWGWLKAMYVYTIVGAGGFGLGMILMPGVVISVFAWPAQDPVVFGITGSVYLSFGLLSVLGLRAPLNFLPVLLLQLTYKTIWLFGVIIPMLIKGGFPAHAVLLTLIFVTYIIGDLIAIPFRYVFAVQTVSEA